MRHSAFARLRSGILCLTTRAAARTSPLMALAIIAMRIACRFLMERGVAFSATRTVRSRAAWTRPRPPLDSLRSTSRVPGLSLGDPGRGRRLAVADCIGGGHVAASWLRLDFPTEPGHSDTLSRNTGDVPGSPGLTMTRSILVIGVRAGDGAPTW